MIKKLPENFHNMYFSGMLILLVIIMSYYWLDANYANLLRERLSYDKLYQLAQILMIVVSLMYLNPIISKQLAKSKTLQKWYINHKAKQWRNSV